jgi:hypothetical protein
VFEQTQRLYFPASGQELGISAGSRDLVERPWLRQMAIYLHDFATLSPLSLVSRKFVNRIRDGRRMPNPYASRVDRRRLKDGRTFLFLPDGPGVFASDRPEEVMAGRRFLSWLKEELGKYNIKLVVLLVPDKYVVYRDLLEKPEPGKKGRYFSALKDAIVGLSIPVVDLTGRFRAQVGMEDLYFPDDTHWNARGIREAARELLPFVIMASPRP